jgi:hypothetical protein
MVTVQPEAASRMPSRHAPTQGTEAETNGGWPGLHQILMTRTSGMAS